MDFKKLSLSDREWLSKAFKEDDGNACEFTFANNFMWRNVYDVMAAKSHGCGVLMYNSDGGKAFSFPIGNGDKRAVISELLTMCEENNMVLRMSPLLDRDRQLLNEWFPGMFAVKEERNNWDYVYTTEKLTKLSGKKLQAKRNHIARFKDIDDWSYERITPDNKEECRKMSFEWMNSNEGRWNDGMEAELNVLHEALDNFTELGLVGGLIRREGRIVAFCIGEPLNSDTFVVHFEKAMADIQGAYPIINQQFAEHECQQFTYINREEDTGAPGLRKAKMSYRPDMFVKKMSAIRSDIVLLDPEKDREGIIEIWQKSFGDDEKLINYYVDNRMTNQNMLGIYMAGKLAAIGSFLPAEYCFKKSESDKSNVPVRYVYALATLPEFRGQKLAVKILDFAKKLWREPLVLCPAELSLAAYYERLGFKWAFAGEEFQISMDNENIMADLEELSITAITAREYKQLRDEAFSDEDFICWDEDAVSYAIDMNKFLGGKTVKVNYQKTFAGTVMYYLDNNSLVITEINMQQAVKEKVIRYLVQENSVSKALYNNLGGMIYTENKEMDKLGNEGYLGLTLG
ncbi:MAG: GNAT family N-acetyltransferase [Eubacteriales bacterium]|nr:GNAT family N-acetyltransferase [Eubacteriales bacterium]